MKREYIALKARLDGLVCSGIPYSTTLMNTIVMITILAFVLKKAGLDYDIRKNTGDASVFASGDDSMIVTTPEFLPKI